MDWRKLERAVDKLERRSFGEEVRLSFFKGIKVDPDRPQWTGRAILHTGGDDSFAVGDRGLGGIYRTRLSAGEAELFLTRDEYDGPAPAVKDVVRAMDRDGEPRWEVSAISGRYSNLWVLSLTQA
jgi:hypothetical protein